MTARTFGALGLGLVLPLLAGMSGCALGPKAIEQTHGLYSSAVRRVDEEEFLKNIVRLRYIEGPRHLDVSAIAAQYELSASAEARPFFSTEATGNLFRSFETVLPFVTVGGANRPTVSLTPQDDGTTVRRYLTPITPETLVFLGQSGWPISSLLRIWVDRMNGVPNGGASSDASRDVAFSVERYRRACDLLQVCKDKEFLSVHAEEKFSEQSGSLPAASITASAVVEAAKSGFEYRPQGNGQTWALVRREKHLILQVNPAGRDSPELAELAGLINLRPGLDRYEVQVAVGISDPAKNPSAPLATLGLAPRSMSQVFFFLARGVEVPPEHVASGVVEVSHGEEQLAATEGLFRVRCCGGHKPPASAAVTVRYRDHWFYIDDRDKESKATLMLMLQLKQLDFKRQTIGSLPALTLPIGR